MSAPGAPAHDDEWAQRVSIGIAAGSREALARLYDARYAQLVRLLRQRTSPDDAFIVDCVHDAWLRIVRALPPRGSIAALDAWIQRAALSAMLDRLKADAARTTREARLSSRPPHGDQSLRDTIDALQHELRSLSLDDRTLLDPRFRRELGWRQIGSILGLGAKAAEMRFRRILTQLRTRREALRD